MSTYKQLFQHYFIRLAIIFKDNFKNLFTKTRDQKCYFYSTFHVPWENKIEQQLPLFLILLIYQPNLYTLHVHRITFCTSGLQNVILGV